MTLTKPPAAATPDQTDVDALRGLAIISARAGEYFQSQDCSV
jgi:hypothetical protein